MTISFLNMAALYIKRRGVFTITTAYSGQNNGAFKTLEMLIHKDTFTFSPIINTVLSPIERHVINNSFYFNKIRIMERHIK